MELVVGMKPLRIFSDDQGMTSFAAMLAVLLVMVLALIAFQAYWLNSRAGDIQPVADAAALAGANALAKFIITTQVLDALHFAVNLVTVLMQGLDGILLAVQVTLWGAVAAGTVGAFFTFGGTGVVAGLAAGWAQAVTTFRGTVMSPILTAMETVQDAVANICNTVTEVLVILAPIASIANAMGVIEANNAAAIGSGRLPGSSYSGFVIPTPVFDVASLNKLATRAQNMAGKSKTLNAKDAAKAHNTNELANTQAQKDTAALKDIEMIKIPDAEQDVADAKAYEAQERGPLQTDWDVAYSDMLTADTAMTKAKARLKTANPTLTDKELGELRDKDKEYSDALLKWLGADGRMKEAKRLQAENEKRITTAEGALSDLRTQFRMQGEAVGKKEQDRADSDAKTKYVGEGQKLKDFITFTSDRAQKPTFPGSYGFMAVVWDKQTHDSPKWIPELKKRQIGGRIAIAGAKLGKSSQDNTFMSLFDDLLSPSGPLGNLSGLAGGAELVGKALGFALKWYAKSPSAIGDFVGGLFAMFGTEIQSGASTMVTGWVDKFLASLGISPPSPEAPKPVLVNTAYSAPVIGSLDPIAEAKKDYNSNFDDATNTLAIESIARRRMGEAVDGLTQYATTAMTQSVADKIQLKFSIPIKIPYINVDAWEIPITLKLPPFAEDWVAGKINGAVTGTGAYQQLKTGIQDAAASIVGVFTGQQPQPAGAGGGGGGSW